MLLSIEIGKNARLVSKILHVLLPDATTILDCTYGNGKFWSNPTQVIGTDINPLKAKDVVADFTHLPFTDNSFDVVVFDPPYHTDMSHHSPSIMGGRFGSFETLHDLEKAVRRGTREAKRISKVGAIIKVQDYIHSAQRVRMTKWVEEAWKGEPYDIVFLMKQNMVTGDNWSTQLSVRSNHTTFLIFRQGSQIHRRRRR